MVQNSVNGALASFCLLFVSFFSLAEARMGSRARSAPVSEDGHSQSHDPSAKLAVVLSQAVDMMNSGVLQFLKEETPNSLPPRDMHHDRRPEDFLRVAKSQERALKLLRQLSNDFTSLNGVTQKLKTQSHMCTHSPHLSEAAASSDVKDKEDEIMHLKNTINVLLKKAEVCQDALQPAQQAAMDCNAKINAQVQNTTNADAKANTDTLQANDMLRAEANQLRERNDDLERRVAGLEGDAKDQQQKALTADVKDLRKKIQGLEEDKQAMIHTMQQFMRTNETETLTNSLKQELATTQRQHLKMEMKYQQKIAILEKRLKESTDKNKAIGEISKELQEDDMNKDQTIDQLKVQINSFQQAQNAAAADKKQLLSTLQGVLRENTHFQNVIAETQGKLKQSEQVRKRDCPVSGGSKPKPKVEPRTSQKQAIEAQNADGDAIATMSEALPINKYITSVSDQNMEDSTQDDSSSPAADQPSDPEKASPAASENSVPAAASENSIPAEQDLPPSLRSSSPHSAPVKSALSRWLGGSQFEAAASRLPQPSAAPPAVQADNSNPADSTNLLARAERSVDEASDDDDSAIL